jgi:short-subunit dehydrogenase involved in D-alanine esterification of teichoic acids
VIFLITDGEASIGKQLQEQFRQTGKKLVVLLLTECVNHQHAFKDLNATIIQIDSSAKVIDRGID